MGMFDSIEKGLQNFERGAYCLSILSEMISGVIWVILIGLLCQGLHAQEGLEFHLGAEDCHN
jgi:hypothetical protein